MPDRKQDGAAWVIRTRLHKVSCAINALTGFATASLEEDRFGILQLTDPTLGTILQAILSLQLVLERHLRSTASTGSRRYASSPGRGMSHLPRNSRRAPELKVKGTSKFARVWPPFPPGKKSPSPGIEPGFLE